MNTPLEIVIDHEHSEKKVCFSISHAGKEIAFTMDPKNARLLASHLELQSNRATATCAALECRSSNLRSSASKSKYFQLQGDAL